MGDRRRSRRRRPRRGRVDAAARQDAASPAAAPVHAVLPLGAGDSTLHRAADARPLSGRPDRRLLGDPQRRPDPVPAPARFRSCRADPGHRVGFAALLLSRRPVDRIYREERAPEGPGPRRHRRDAVQHSSRHGGSQLGTRRPHRAAVGRELGTLRDRGGGRSPHSLRPSGQRPGRARAPLSADSSRGTRDSVHAAPGNRLRRHRSVERRCDRSRHGQAEHRDRGSDLRPLRERAPGVPARLGGFHRCRSICRGSP